MNKHVPGSAESSSPFSAASWSPGPAGFIWLLRATLGDILPSRLPLSRPSPTAPVLLSCQSLPPLPWACMRRGKRKVSGIRKFYALIESLLLSRFVTLEESLI